MIMLQQETPANRAPFSTGLPTALIGDWRVKLPRVTVEPIRITRGERERTETFQTDSRPYCSLWHFFCPRSTVISLHCSAKLERKSYFYTFVILYNRLALAE